MIITMVMTGFIFTTLLLCERLILRNLPEPQPQYCRVDDELC